MCVTILVGLFETTNVQWRGFEERCRQGTSSDTTTLRRHTGHLLGGVYQRVAVGRFQIERMFLAAVYCC